MLAVTDNLTLVKGILDRMLVDVDLRPLLDGLAEDVVFGLATPDTDADAQYDGGKAAVHDYFTTLGDLVTFWRAKYFASGARVVVLIEERFTVQPAGLAADGEFALVFDLHDGRITRLLVLEDPTVLPVVAGEWHDYSGEDGACARVPMRAT